MERAHRHPRASKAVGELQQCCWAAEMLNCDSIESNHTYQCAISCDFSLSSQLLQIEMFQQFRTGIRDSVSYKEIK
eukprot:486237-Amphidinium_carterae.1